MASARTFAYNPGTTIPGTEQLGNLSIGIPTSGFTNNPQYWNGPDEDLGYVIAKPISGNTQPTQVTEDAITLSSTYKGTDISVTNNNQTAAQIFGYQQSVLGETIISGTNQVMFSVLCNLLEPSTLIGSHVIGVGTISMNYSSQYGAYPGNDIYSIGFSDDGNYYFDGGVVVSGLPTWTNGDTIDIAISHGQYWWVRVNGGNWNNNPSANPTTLANGLTMNGVTNFYPVLCPAYQGIMTVLNYPKYGVPSDYNFLGNVTASVGFNRSPLKTEQSFVDYTNSVFGQNFVDGASAKIWLNDNGYWTSYELVTPTPTTTTTLTATPTQTSSETPTNTPTKTPTTTPTLTATPTQTSSETPTPTQTPTTTLTATQTQTQTSTQTPTTTTTLTATPTQTQTSTQTPTTTTTLTATPTQTSSQTPTQTPTFSGVCNTYYFGIDTIPGQSTRFGYYLYTSGAYTEVVVTSPGAIFVNAYSYPGVFYVSGDAGYTIENYGPCGPTPTPTSTPTQTPTPLGCTSYTVSTTSATGQSFTYTDCDGTPTGGNIGGASGFDAETFCAQTGTVDLVGVELTLTINGPCSDPTPSPTPTQTKTPTQTSTTTLTATPPSDCTSYTVSTTSASGQSFTYTDCDGTETGGNIGGSSGYDAETFCARTGTVNLIGVELTLTINGTCFLPTPTPTETLTPTVPLLYIDVQTNASLDITLNNISVNGNVASVSGGVWPNTPGNGANLYVNIPQGIYDVVIGYTASVGGQKIEITSPVTGTECQNTGVGVGSLTFTNVGLLESTPLSVLASDGVCI